MEQVAYQDKENLTGKQTTKRPNDHAMQDWLWQYGRLSHTSFSS